jgi:hypothetical protein
MKEPLDLGQALKAEIERDLKDWTFTPEMRQNVLARARQTPPKRSRLPWWQPASVAAAAVLITLVSRHVPFRMGTASVPQEKSQATDLGAPAQSSTGAAKAEPPAPSEDSKPKDSSGAQSSEPNAATMGLAPVPGAGGEANAENVTTMGIPSLKAMDGAGLRAFGLVAPEHGPKPGPRIAPLPDGKGVVALTSQAATLLRDSLEPNWEVTLPRLSSASQVAVSPEGRIGVTADTALIILGADGTTQASLQLPEPIRRAIWGSGERLLLAGERAAYLQRSPGAQILTLPEPNVTGAAFAPDGRLALGTADGLALYDNQGRRLWKREGTGPGPLFSPDGTRILCGNSLFDGEGNLVTPLPSSAEGAIPYARGFLAWQARELTAYAWTGKLLWRWRPPYAILGLFPGENGKLWVLMQTGEGGAIQALTEGGRPIGEPRSIGAEPLGGAAANGKLYLLTDQGLQMLDPLTP